MTAIAKIALCIAILALWLWSSADDWEHDQELERAERQRIHAIQQYQQSLQSYAPGEDEVDVTPIPVAEAEPKFVSAPVQTAKKRVVQAKKRIKKSVNK